jgi:hypothetical protein
MECQFLIAQLPVLLEKRAAQHRFGWKSLPSGSLDAAVPQVSRDQPKQATPSDSPPPIVPHY